LIALDKCPGVCLIVDGKTLRRLLGNTICLVTHFDASVVCGVDQLCVGCSMELKGLSIPWWSFFNGNKNGLLAGVC